MSFFHRQIVHCFALSCCLFAVLTTTALAQTNSNFSDLQAILPQSCFLSGQFSQAKQLADIPKPLDSRGQFIFNCQQGLIWITEIPVHETLVYRRDSKHHIIIPDTQPQRLKGRIHRELGKILNNLIGADVEYLQQHFDYSGNGESHTLTPKNKRLRQHIASITINPTTDGTRLLIAQSEGESITITIAETTVFSAFNKSNCGELIATQAQACALLFQ